MDWKHLAEKEAFTLIVFNRWGIGERVGCYWQWTNMQNRSDKPMHTISGLINSVTLALDGPSQVKLALDNHYTCETSIVDAAEEDLVFTIRKSEYGFSRFHLRRHYFSSSLAPTLPTHRVYFGKMI